MKYAVAVVIQNKEGKVLMAKRSATKYPFPKKWALPSTSFKEGEDPKEKLVQVIKKKLGIDIEIKSKIGTKKGKQLNYWLELTDYKAEIIRGIPKPDNKNYSEVKYVDFKEYCKNKDLSEEGFCIQILSDEI